MREILCGRTPAVLHSPQLARALDFYTTQWGFSLVQHVPGVVAILRRESVAVHLMQLRSDMAAEAFACKLLVDDVSAWGDALVSAPGQVVRTVIDQPWGLEVGLSDCDGHRLFLVQSAPHRFRRARA